MKDRLKKAIKAFAESFDVGDADLNVNYPDDLARGDYMLNTPLVLAKKLNKKPQEIAEELKIYLQKEFINDDLKLDIAGPGFLNITLSKDSIRKKIISLNQNFGQSDSWKGKKVLFEYTDPNPFKQFHIGHLMSNAVGETLSRLVENAGAEVIRAPYQGDVGLHVAKAIWGMQKNRSELPSENDSLEMKTAFLGKCYVQGSEQYEENKEAIEEIKNLNKIIFDKSDSEINKLYDFGRAWSLEHFEEIYNKLGTKFDKYFFESAVAEKGIALVMAGLEKGVFEKSEGAIVFPGEKYGLHTRVFINSQGLPTYEAKELGLNKTKFEQISNLDKSFIITATEQLDYFKVLLKVFEEMKVLDDSYNEISAKTVHIAHGMMRFKGGKMSSRKGNVITGEALISQMEEMAMEKMKDRELDTEDRKKIATSVAVGAIKYAILRQAPGGDIIYDPEKAVSFEGDSGPYLQYTAVRAGAILHKAQKEDISMPVYAKDEEMMLIISQERENLHELERLIIRFEDIVHMALSEYAPQHIAQYLLHLSASFNAYYANYPVIGSGEAENYRFALVRAFKIIMKNGLWILGISIPDKM